MDEEDDTLFGGYLEEDEEREVLRPAIDGQTIGNLHRSLNTAVPEDLPLPREEAPAAPLPSDAHVGRHYPYKPPQFHTPNQSLVIVVPASAYGMPDIVQSFSIGDMSTRNPSSLAALRLLMFIYRACFDVQRGLGKMDPPRKRGGRNAGADDADEDEDSPDPRIGDLFDHQPGEMPFTFPVEDRNGSTFGAPRISLVRECLLGNDARVAGMRFVFQANDPTICLNKMVSDLITRLGIDQTEGATRRNRGPANVVSTSDAVSSRITSVEVWAQTLVDYFGPGSSEGLRLLDQMHQITNSFGGMTIRNTQNPGCPTEVLTFERTCTLVKRTVCVDQLTLANYGDLRDGDMFYYKAPLAKYLTFGMSLTESVETFYGTKYAVPREMATWIEVLNTNRMPGRQFCICVPEETKQLAEQQIAASVRSDFAQPEPLELDANSSMLSEADVWALCSFTERRRRINEPIMKEIRRIRPSDDENPADPDVQRRTEEFSERMSTFVEEKIEEAWEDFCDPSKLVKTTSAAQIAALHHIATMTEADWPDFPKVAENLTVGGSLILSFFNRMMQAFKVKPGATPRNILVMWFGGLAASVWRPGGCGANVSIFDGPAAGKSFMMTVCHDMLLPGAVRNASVLTPKALTAAVSRIGMVFFFHEAGPQHFGLDQNGRPTTKDDNGFASLIKTALTEQQITTTSVVLDDDGTRKEVSVRARIGAAFHFASNAMPETDPASPPAMLTRTIRIENGGTHAVTDKDEEVFLSSSTSSENSEATKSDFILETRTIHALVLLVGMMIDMDILPMPNIDVGVRLLRNLSIFVVQKGYESIVLRKQEQIESLFIGFVLQMAVMKVVASELSLKYRPDQSGLPRPIGPWFFKEVRKHLMLDTEMAIFVLTLVPEMLMPALPSSVMNRMNELIETKQVSTAPLMVQDHLRQIEDTRFVVFEVPLLRLADMVSAGLNGATPTSVLEVLRSLAKRTYTGSGTHQIEKRTETGAPANTPIPWEGPWTVRIMNRLQNGNERSHARGDRFAVCLAALKDHAGKSARELFVQFIEDTLCHAYANRRTIVTALPMEISVGPNQQKKTINALMPIKVFPVPGRLQGFQSGYQVRLCDQVLGQSRMKRPATRRDNTLPVTFATADYDEEAVLTYGRSIGIPASVAALYSPKALTEAVHAIRAENVTLFETQEMEMLSVYPDAYLNIRVKEIELKDICPPEIVTPDLAKAMEDDPMFRNNVIGRQRAFIAPAAESTGDLFADDDDDDEVRRAPAKRIRKGPMEIVGDRIDRMRALLMKTNARPSPKAAAAAVPAPAPVPQPYNLVAAAGSTVAPAPEKPADLLRTAKGASSFLRNATRQPTRVVTVASASQ